MYNYQEDLLPENIKEFMFLKLFMFFFLTFVDEIKPRQAKTKQKGINERLDYIS
jgi:hypothetical protein